MASRPSWLLLLAAAVLALLSACATGPASIDISRQQLQAALERRFPYEARPGGLFVVNVGVPRLQLLPEENRVRLDFTLETGSVLLRGAGRGTLSVVFGLRYQASDATLRATNVRVENIALDGMPGEWRTPLQLAGSLVAENLLEDTVLHALRPEDLARARGWTPGSIRVTPSGVRIALVPPVAQRPSCESCYFASN